MSDRPVFLLLGAAPTFAAAVGARAARPLGFEPDVRAAPLPSPRHPEAGESLTSLVAEHVGPVFLLPVSLELGVFEREALSRAVAEMRRLAPRATIHHDEADTGHPLLLQAFEDTVASALARGQGTRGMGQVGLLLVASGDGDAGSRADAYRAMRLLWERLGAADGEVAFLRHTTPFLRSALERLDPALRWAVAPWMLDRGEPFEHLRLILEDHQRNRPESACAPAAPPADHPALVEWAVQRMATLWRERRQADAGRVRSAKAASRAPARRLGAGPETGLIAEVRDAAELRALLPEAVLDAETVFVKVTWHGYATGTYTDPTALDALLAALPHRVVLLEGHTSSRNTAGRVEWDWETGSRERRGWIRAQEGEFLEKTGLAEVIRRHGAQYLNVTEAWWDGACAPPAPLEVELHDAEIASFVPAVLLENRGAPLISFARFKGPTRLSLSNLFGLLPQPLRADRHGPNISYFARACCDLARLYGSLLDLYGLVEGLNYAVKWDRRGLYRSRWGNYDLIPQPGLATLSRGVAAADVLAARLQGQDARRSAFYDVVRAELGVPEAAEELEPPEQWLRLFV